MLALVPAEEPVIPVTLPGPVMPVWLVGEVATIAVLRAVTSIKRAIDIKKIRKYLRFSGASGT